MGTTIALLAGGLAVLLTALLPRRFGPAVALVLFALMPRFVFADNSLIQGYPPFAWVLSLWALRSMLGRRMSSTVPGRRSLVAFLLAASVVWFGFTGLWSISVLTSAGWLVPFLFGVVVLFAFLRDGDTAETLVRAWMTLTVVLSLYAVVEFLLGANPVYDALRQLLATPDLRTWAVYRINSSFGHPLYAALFYSVSAGFALGWAILKGARRLYIVAVLSAAATVFTFSRTGIVALALSFAAVLAVAVFTRARLSLIAKSTIVLLCGVGALLVYRLPQLQERLFSTEAESSVGARAGLFQLAAEVAAVYGYRGSGIGTSALAAAPLNADEVLIENGYLQLLISAGSPGVILFALILLVAAFGALRRKNIAALGALVAFAVMTAGFNAVESNPTVLILLGVCVALAYFGEPGRATAPTPQPPQEPVDQDDVRRADARSDRINGREKTAT